MNFRHILLPFLFHFFGHALAYVISCIIIILKFILVQVEFHRKGTFLWIKRYDFVVFIKEVRVQLDLSQEDLAREIGVSFATVNRWENERFQPSRLALRSVETYCDRMIELGMLLLDDL